DSEKTCTVARVSETDSHRGVEAHQSDVWAVHSDSVSIPSLDCALVLGSLLDSCTYIIMGTHKEGGATTFWSYVLNLPLSSNSIVSWKFCYLVHKILRDGHRNVIPGNLEASDETLEKEAGSDMNKVEANQAKSTTPAGQCRLMPLIPLIQDCSFLYHFSVRLLFKLHSRISPDVLLGHRERFRDLFMSLTQFFDKAREMEFFKTFIQIPDLPDAPPNFLRAAALAEYKKPVVVMPNEEHHEEEEDVEPQPEFREASQIPQYYLLNQMGTPDSSVDQREMENDSLKRELDVLKPELQIIKNEAQRCVTELKAQVNRLEAEVEEQRTHKQMAIVENEHLRMEVEALRSTNVANIGAQIGFKEADGEKQKLEIDRLKRDLESTRAELAKANNILQNKEMVRTFRAKLLMLETYFLASTSLEDYKTYFGTQLNNTLAGLQVEKEGLLRMIREQEAELKTLRQQTHLQQSSLDQLAQKLQEEQFCLLQCAVVEAEGIILDAVAKLDDPIHVRCISSPDYLVNRAEITLNSIDKMQQSHLAYLGNSNDASGLLRAVTQFSHLAADTIVNGSATSHSLSAVCWTHADLTDSCRDCANNCLQFLKDLKIQASLQRADPSAIRYTVQRILAVGQDLRPKGHDVLKEELGSMVDKEMLATSTAIEEAVLRMDEILSQAKKDNTGVKLEVNQNILGSCSDLMKAVHMLVTAATDLQKDIVEGGRGAATVTEFYAKNSRWTEGLISASKAVGWGATQLLDSADRVVGEKGTYEELIACSHEIAASTAQLVAASKVKADRNNKKLNTLQQASRHVNDMAAVVVTSTKHGQQQISDHGLMDFSGMSLIKLKKEEMEAQVKVLQLESQLEQERVRLGELRKRHYELGVSEDGGDGIDSFPPPPPPTLYGVYQT
uniref:Huntingtin-interacting protein 1-related protein n=1 Tax=Oreochromis niloticus TaxID=8128 RepID=A0A669D2N1_ORENI